MLVGKYRPRRGKVKILDPCLYFHTPTTDRQKQEHTQTHTTNRNTQPRAQKQPTNSKQTNDSRQTAETVPDQRQADGAEAGQALHDHVNMINKF